MNVIKTNIEGVVILEPRVWRDDRGYFLESFSQREFEAKVCKTIFVQDNEAWSRRGVIRGLHYQLSPTPQSKLVRAVSGRIIDVAVDVRVGSPTFGRYAAVELSGENHRQLFVPRGFAHGYSVLSDQALVAYKCDNPYAPQSESGIRFDDPSIGVEWGVPAAERVVSERDIKMPLLAEARLFDYKTNLY